MGAKGGGKRRGGKRSHFRGGFMNLAPKTFKAYGSVVFFMKKKLPLQNRGVDTKTKCNFWGFLPISHLEGRKCMGGVHF